MRLIGKSIPYRYYTKIYILGDEITPYLIEHLFGAEPYVGHQSSPHLLATGSVFFLASERSVIWGSGILHPSRGYI